jgi:hypothetical protein
MDKDLDLEKQHKPDETSSDGLPDAGQGGANSTHPSNGHGHDQKETISAPAKDPNAVEWDGKDDPKHPRNWSMGRKWAAITVVSSFVLITPIASSMTAPALPQISEDLGIQDEVLSQMSLSIFVLAYGTSDRERQSIFNIPVLKYRL